jgi:cation-transporting ATPase E
VSDAPPASAEGLTGAQVAERVRRGQTNAEVTPSSRSIGDIVRRNVFTFFNGLLFVMLVAILRYGQALDALFGFVLLLNVSIGIAQELRAKRTLDRLSFIAAPRVRVVRDGVVGEVAVAEVVLDDVVELRSGDQVVADGVVLAAAGLEVDESLLTGEAVPVLKSAGDRVMSGSFCVAGSGRMRADGVGAASHAQRLAAEAKRFRRVPSELLRGTDRILQTIAVLLVPIATLFVVSRFQMGLTQGRLVTQSVAALVGMVPFGFVLLTSIAFAVSVIRLASRGALIEELPAVEILARVDVVCLDKTGTLTDSGPESVTLETVDGADEAAARAALASLASLDEPGSPGAGDATARALAAAFGGAALPHSASVPFSSARKWSAADLGGAGAWVLGAPDVLLPAGDALRGRADIRAATGARVLLLARTPALPAREVVPAPLEPQALVVLQERVRSDAATTLAYFREQGVALKVISGDSPATAASVAARAGLELAGEPVDARNLPKDPAALADLVESHTVFGRVGPEQKRDMVAALQSRGHVVAMTGDGVNDVLALKTADLGIAMGAGAPAARAVADLVLVDGRFSALPGVVAEGRRVIANVERVANLFVTKSVYAALLALGAAAFAVHFPLLPRHFTLVDAVTIGIPGFFLALAPAAPRYRPGFLARVLRFTLVCGAVMAAAAAGAYAWALRTPIAHAAGRTGEARTVVVWTLMFTGLWVLVELSRPLTRGRIALVASMAAAAFVLMFVPLLRTFFALPYSPPGATLVVAAATVVAAVAMEAGLRIVGWRPAIREESDR